MKIRREWAMPTSETFTCPPIRSFVNYYLQQSKISIDPFARNYQGCTYTNDLNPNTKAEFNMDALDFLKMIVDKGIRANLLVFDPPYSPRQIMECYNGIGKTMTQQDGQRSHSWSKEKNIISSCLHKNGIFLNFGWNTRGMGIKRGFTIEEILIVCHGAGHNDTLCTAERRTSEQIPLFPPNKPLKAEKKDVSV